MFKNLFVLILLLVSSASFAEEPAPKVPAKPALNGEHEMVIVKDGSSVFLSHVPRYDEPQAYQIIYQMEVLPTHLAFLQLIGGEDVVTFKPNEPFDLQLLIAGLPLKLTGTVYAGRVERGARAMYSDFEIHLEKQKYVRKLADAEAASNFQTYDIVPISRGHRLLIHQIQQRPSYDHVFLLVDNIACPNYVITTSSVPEEAEIYRRMTSCGSIKPLYYEAEDFQ